MSTLRKNAGLLFVWLAFTGGYAAVSLALGRGAHLTAFADVAVCAAVLCTNAGLLRNAASSDWRRNSFWMLLGLGFGLWFAGHLLWTYFEVIRREAVPAPFPGDVIFFLHTVPLLSALALRPHAAQADRNLRFAHLDFLLLLSWWVYLYLFVVIPWQYVTPNINEYRISFSRLYVVENLSFACLLLYLVIRSKGPWRKVYAHLAGASLLYILSSQLIYEAVTRGHYYRGSAYDLPFIASFLWFGTAGVIAHRAVPAARVETAPPDLDSQVMPVENLWPARMAMSAALSLPALAIWSVLASDAPEDVRRFRLLTTLIAMAVMTSLVFLRLRLVDDDRLRLLQASRDSLTRVQRIQRQFVQAEKLASLGQLAAGAAHEINNPLAAILGYSELLADDPKATERSRSVAEKIREQARRTKAIVENLLSFAQSQPAERTLLDIGSVLSSALDLRRLDLLEKNIRIELRKEGHIPGVRGDASQLLQVFFNIISNAVDAMEEAGGVLTVRAKFERAHVIIEFSDSGPGIREPHLVFDPFYTTKPVGKGAGLGLSICYGIVKEHKGQITCANRPRGGAQFRIELPAVMAPFPLRGGDESGSVVPSKRN
ncbi:MAG: HAMP domain-containing sensor histidine kinase [Candidatus Acidiferrales bacterium]